jgi:hypothetical protein
MQRFAIGAFWADSAARQRQQSEQTPVLYLDPNHACLRDVVKKTYKVPA